MSFAAVPFGSLVYSDFFDDPEIIDGWVNLCPINTSWSPKAVSDNTWTDNNVANSGWANKPVSLLPTQKCKD